MVSLKMVKSLLLWFLKVQSHDFINIDGDQSVWRRSVFGSLKGQLKKCVCVTAGSKELTKTTYTWLFAQVCRHNTHPSRYEPFNA